MSNNDTMSDESKRKSSNTLTTNQQQRYICDTALRLEYDDRLTLLQFLMTHFRDTPIIKECNDGVRINLNILSDEMVDIIYSFIQSTLLK